MKRIGLLPLAALLLVGLVAKVALVGDRVISSFSSQVILPVAHASDGGEGQHGGAAAGEGHDGGKAGGEGHGEAKPPKREKACPPPPPPPEPTGPTFSEAELTVLQQLAQRRDNLAARENDLKRQETVMQATESRIDEKVASLKQLQKTLEGLIRQHDSEQDNKLKSLVKIYETMKPTDAARILEQLDLDTLLPVVEKMNERKLAAIMANLNPSKAKELTVELKKLRELTVPPPT